MATISIQDIRTVPEGNLDLMDRNRSNTTDMPRAVHVCGDMSDLVVPTSIDSQYYLSDVLAGTHRVYRILSCNLDILLDVPLGVHRDTHHLQSNIRTWRTTNIQAYV